MTLLSLRRADADDATLVRRARRGDRRAHRLFARRHAVRAIELVGILLDDPTESATLAAAVLDLAVADGVTDDDGLVRCAVQVLAPAAGERGLARLVLWLSDVEGRTEDSVGELVGRGTDEVAELRATALASHGVTPHASRECRGWALTARRDRLTVSEQEAANGHLLICRPCRERLDEQRRTRDKLRLSSAGVGSVIVADVVALSLPAGGAVAGFGAFGSAIAGKAGAALIGGAAVAIAGTSAGLVIARQSPSHDIGPAVVRHVGPAGTAGTVGTSQPPSTGARQSPADGRPAAPGGAGSRSAPPGTGLLPTTLPTSVVSSLVTSPAPALPSTLPLPLPTATSIISAVPVPVPTSIATTSLPVPLPTGVVATATSLLGP